MVAPSFELLGSVVVVMTASVVDVGDTAAVEVVVWAALVVVEGALASIPVVVRGSAVVVVADGPPAVVVVVAGELALLPAVVVVEGWLALPPLTGGSAVVVVAGPLFWGRPVVVVPDRDGAMHVPVETVLPPAVLPNPWPPEQRPLLHVHCPFAHPVADRKEEHGTEHGVELRWANPMRWLVRSNSTYMWSRAAREAWML